MNLVLDARGQNSFVVPVIAQIDSITINNGSPGQFVTLLFLQDGTGHTVAAGSGNLAGFLAVDSTASAVTAQSFTFNSQGNKWVNIVPPSASDVISVFGRSGVVVATTGDYTVAKVTGAAPLDAPTFTGVPAAPTAAPGTNTTQLGTTAFVTAAVAALAAKIKTNRTNYTIQSADVTAGFAQFAVTWSVAFADANYTVAQAISDAGAIEGNDYSPGDMHSFAAGGYTAVIYVNSASALAGTVITLNSIGIHD